MSVNKDLLLILKSTGLGDGEPDLGLRLIGSFLNMLLETDNIPAKIICMNSGIFLSTAGSPVEDSLNKLIQAGSEILTCSTCLEYYGRTDKLVVGSATNMRDTVQAMMTYRKVLSP